MTRLLYIAFCAVLLIGCSKTDSNDDVEFLKENFHGKYKLISSTSEKAVDLNMDGYSSTDLLSENPIISESELEIRIYDVNSNLFEEKWTMENSQIPRDEVYDPNRVYSTDGLNYAKYINFFPFEFNENFKSIKLLTEVYKDNVNTLIGIESVIMEEKGFIKVTTTRKLYTKVGWIATQIESRYKRYSKVT